MSKRTLLLIVILIIITGGLLYLALKGPTISPPSYKVQIKPPATQTAKSTLSFGVLSTTTSSSSAKPAYTLPIILNSKNYKITAAQLELSYDPQILSNVSIREGGFFTNPVILLNQIDEKNGRISFALGIPPATSGIVGQDTVATLAFSAKNTVPKTTTITLLPKSLITAVGFAQSVLQGTTSATITVGQLPATPSPFPH